MKQANESVRNDITAAGLTYWQVAAEVGIASTTLSVWLRTPLTQSRQKRVESAINALTKGATVNA